MKTTRDLKASPVFGGRVKSAELHTQRFSPAWNESLSLHEDSGIVLWNSRVLMHGFPSDFPREVRFCAHAVVLRCCGH